MQRRKPEGSAVNAQLERRHGTRPKKGNRLALHHHSPDARRPAQRIVKPTVLFPVKPLPNSPTGYQMHPQKVKFTTQFRHPRRLYPTRPKYTTIPALQDDYQTNRSIPKEAPHNKHLLPASFWLVSPPIQALMSHRFSPAPRVGQNQTARMVHYLVKAHISF